LTRPNPTSIHEGIAGVGARDYDGDGKTDIRWRLNTLGEVWVWRLGGPVKASEASLGIVADHEYQVVR